MMKLRASRSFISQTQTDGTEIVPEKMKRVRLFPTLEEIKQSDARQLAARRKKEAEEGGGSAKKAKKSPSSDDALWLDRLGKKSAAKEKERKAKQPKPTIVSKKGLCQGAYVYTRDSRIAPKSLVPHPGGSRCYRLKYKGTIMKPSMYYENVWIVLFDDSRCFSCSEGLLHLISKTSPTHCLVRDEENQLVLEKIDRTYEDREIILDTILNSKIHCTIGHDKVTYDTLIDLFKPKFAWLTASKLRKHVSVSRRLLAINTPTNTASTHHDRIWLNELPSDDNDKNSKSSSEANTDSDIPKCSAAGEEPTSSIAGRNHGDVDSDDFIENHGLACTCCGVRSDKVSKSDINQMHIHRAMTGHQAMIVNVSVDLKTGARSCGIKSVPTYVDKTLTITELSESICDRDYNNKLNEKLGINRRIDNDLKVIDIESGTDDDSSIDERKAREREDDESVKKVIEVEDVDDDVESAVFDGEDFVMVGDSNEDAEGEKVKGKLHIH